MRQNKWSIRSLNLSVEVLGKVCPLVMNFFLVGGYIVLGHFTWK